MAGDTHIQNLARRLRRLERQALASKQPTLGYSSIDDGAITSVDQDGQIQMIIGKQHDGTQVSAVVTGPPPPQPTPATLQSVLGGVRVHWDGTYEGGELSPMDWARTTIHAYRVDDEDSFDPLDESHIVGFFSSATGGAVGITLPTYDDYEITLVSWSAAGKFSSPSTPAIGSSMLISFPDLAEEAAQELAKIQQALDAADAAGSTAADALSAANNAADDAAAAQAVADAAAQDVVEVAGLLGDKAVIRIQGAAPGVDDQNENTLWIDTSDGNAPKRWDGTNWVVVQDAAVAQAASDAAAAASAASQAQSAADDAAQAAQEAKDDAVAAANAADAAGALAQSAMDSASGKNTIMRATYPPTNEPNTEGDIWWHRSGVDGSVLGLYQGLGGTSWEQTEITNEIVGNLDAGKITFGTMSGERIEANSLTIGKVQSLQATLDEKATEQAAQAMANAAQAAAIAAAEADATSKAAAAQAAAEAAAQAAANAAQAAAIAEAEGTAEALAAAAAAQAKSEALSEAAADAASQAAAAQAAAIAAAATDATSKANAAEAAAIAAAATDAQDKADAAEAAAIAAAAIEAQAKANAAEAAAIAAASGDAADKAEAARLAAIAAAATDAAAKANTARDDAVAAAATAAETAYGETKTLVSGWRTTGQTTINGGKITADSITAAQIASGAITAEQIAAGTITANEIAAGAITAAKIDAGAITADKIAADAIDGKTVTGATFKGGSFELNTDNSYLSIREAMNPYESIPFPQIELGGTGSNDRGRIFGVPVVSTEPTAQGGSVFIQAAIPDIGSSSFRVYGEWHPVAEAALYGIDLRTTGTIVLDGYAAEIGNLRVRQGTISSLTGSIVIRSAGSLGLRTGDSSVNALLIATDNTVTTNSRLEVGGTVAVSGQIDAPNMTNGSGPNVTYNAGNGRLRVVGSSRRFKDNIRDADDLDVEAILALTPRQYERNDFEESPEFHEIGFIAEEADDLGLSDWVFRDSEGEIFSFDYSRWVVALQHVVRYLNDRVTALESETHP